jgi:hypothetical protein
MAEIEGIIMRNISFKGNHILAATCFLSFALLTACNPDNLIKQSPAITSIDSASIILSTYSEIVANQRYHYQGDVSICLTSTISMNLEQEQFARGINPNTFIGAECKDIHTKYTDQITIIATFDKSGSSATVQARKYCGNTCSYNYTYKFRKYFNSWIMTEYLPGAIS